MMLQIIPSYFYNLYRPCDTVFSNSTVPNFLSIAEMWDMSLITFTPLNFIGVAE